jgi:hypothetical protein
MRGLGHIQFGREAFRLAAFSFIWFLLGKVDLESGSGSGCINDVSCIPSDLEMQQSRCRFPYQWGKCIEEAWIEKEILSQSGVFGYFYFAFIEVTFRLVFSDQN